MIRWKWEEIQEILTEILVSSKPQEFKFPTKRDAENFAYSIYNYRRRKNFSKELSISISEIDSEYFVTIFKPVKFELKRVI